MSPLLDISRDNMSSSPEASPTTSTSGRTFSISRDKFTVDIPSPRLQLATNGNGAVNGNGTLSSPNPLKSPNNRRMQNFSREGILGSAQKARNLSQSSGDRESMTNGLQSTRQASDDGINPLKRRSTDAGIDYPRRRATIAVSKTIPIGLSPPDKVVVRDLSVSQVSM